MNRSGKGGDAHKGSNSGRCRYNRWAPRAKVGSPDWNLERPAAMREETPNRSCDLRKRKAHTAPQLKFLEPPSCSGLLVHFTGQTQAKAEVKGTWVAQSVKVSVCYSVKSRNLMNTTPLPLRLCSLSVPWHKLNVTVGLQLCCHSGGAFIRSCVIWNTDL